MFLIFIKKYKGTHKYKAEASSLFVIITLTLLTSTLFINVANNAEATHATTSIISTRGHFNPYWGNLQTGQTRTGYTNATDIPACSTELRDVIIFVHGWNAEGESAIDQFNLVKKSIENNSYTEPIIGFSWDSYAFWPIAKDIAEGNGPKLAQFILDFKTECEHANIRLVAHSLGARVILNALESLHEDSQLQSWNSRNYKIASIHLLGAAINPKDVSMATLNGFGIFIRNELNSFYNEFSPEDNVLQEAYHDLAEGHYALGQIGAAGITPKPSNYDENDVSGQISQDTDGDGNNDTTNLGDNHMGYMGVVNYNNDLTDDGAMDMVVGDWRN
jgi:pimeloyl-ACP methyl ester carboxylesterase